MLVGIRVTNGASGGGTWLDQAVGRWLDQAVGMWLDQAAGAVSGGAWLDQVAGSLSAANSMTSASDSGSRPMR